LLDAAQAGKRDARSGDLRKCIANECPRKPPHVLPGANAALLGETKTKDMQYKLAACIKLLVCETHGR
jgi:hypothetical protein